MFGAALNQDLPSGGQVSQGNHEDGDEDRQNAFINLMEHRGETVKQSNGQAGK